MRDEKSLVTAKKRQSSQVQMRAVFVALISKFQSVITADRPKLVSTENLFKIFEWAGVDKIRLAILLKIHHGAEMIHKMENLPVNEKQPLFARAFNTDPPRLEANRRLKSKQSAGNSFEIDAIFY